MKQRLLTCLTYSAYFAELFLPLPAAYAADESIRRLTFENPALADFNGDGLLDVAGVSEQRGPNGARTRQFYVYLQQSGELRLTQVVRLPKAIRELNLQQLLKMRRKGLQPFIGLDLATKSGKNGLPDVYICRRYAGPCSLYRLKNQGDGTFSTARRVSRNTTGLSFYPLSAVTPYSDSTVDLNGDGYAEQVRFRYEPEGANGFPVLAVRLSTGNNGFADEQLYTIDSTTLLIPPVHLIYPQSLRLYPVDYDSDGDFDLGFSLRGTSPYYRLSNGFSVIGVLSNNAGILNTATIRKTVVLAGELEVVPTDFDDNGTPEFVALSRDVEWVNDFDSLLGLTVELSGSRLSILYPK